jgi:hypothetical protein
VIYLEVSGRRLAFGFSLSFAFVLAVGGFHSFFVQG